MERRKRMEHDKYDYAYIRIDLRETYSSRWAKLIVGSVIHGTVDLKI